MHMEDDMAAKVWNTAVNSDVLLCISVSLFSEMAENVYRDSWIIKRGPKQHE